MYEIVIDSDQFKGQRMLQQHRMINDVSKGTTCSKVSYQSATPLVCYLPRDYLL